ncbi:MULTISPECIES: protein translocase subunit SecD [unclassified Luteimonas]|uniref:protein translocase subunit SecD n=1 Tax=unclassified Luteimonas TaxID=2629088 RepID=UPI001604580D|nr:MULTISPECIES: protein translocase subunit SecD [unclassified Luteimonas]MBB1472159.1 protein translocase subunit SecD [Luteimonas sp. MC1782]MBB6599114.1 protein translocase subunit SecD [Luteimonas sp. MC1825]QOC89240.1 protein translocase subunit SecD [Luteimonas sp. MC1825]
MLEFPRWKYVVILIVVLLSALYALPNIYPQDPSVQITANRGATIGAELRGKVDAALAEAGVTAKAVDTDDKEMMVRLASLSDQTLVADALRPVLGEDYIVALNLASTVPAWLEAVGARPMLLGLDLQGGVHFVLQVDQKAALDKRLDAYADEIRAVLRDNRIRYESVERTAGGVTVANLADAADADRAMRLLATAQPTLLREAVGKRITTRVPDVELNQISTDAIDQNITTLRNRIDEIGVGDPVITRQGADRVVVQLPGVQDTAEAKRMIGATATLEYRAVVDGDPFDAVASGNVPPEARVYYRREVGVDGRPIPVLLNKRVIASGEQMVTAQSTLDENGMPAVSVTLNNLGGQRMFDFTSMSVGKPMAVVYIERIPQLTTNAAGEEVRSFRVSEEVISVANINGVFGKQFQTTGLEKAEADGLARLLRSGSLAAPMDFIEERIVGPSLGKENVARGTTAVLYAFVFTLLFFGIYYRMFGLFTCIALLLNLLMVVAIMSLFGATMSLPGFAGLALSIGMSVDANVLINERIREELRAGMPARAAIANGYDKASGTIFDSNMTALLAGIALFAFGTGPLKGFAVTMVIGILTSVFTAVTVSRGIATLVYGGRKKLTTLPI